MAGAPARPGRGTRGLRALAWVLGGSLALVAVALAVLLILLARGPISLDFLTPRLVEALQPEDGSYAVRIGTTELLWAGGSRGIDLTVNDVAFADPNGAPIATFPQVAIHLSIPALLEGSIAPREIDLISPEIRLVREPDGSIGLGLGRSGSEAGGRSLLESFSGAESETEGEAPPASAWLRAIAVRDGRLALTDRVSGFETTVTGLRARVDLDGDALATDLSGDVALGPERFPIRVRATRPEPAGETQLAISLPDVDPQTLAQSLSPLVATGGASAASVADAAARFDMPLDVNVEVAFGGERAWSSVRVRARGENGTLGLAPLLLDPVALKQIALEGSAGASSSGAPERAQIDLTADAGGPSLHVVGSWENGALEATASVAKLPASAIASYWPASAATKARTWVTSNITEGEVRSASATLEGTGGLGDDASFALQKVDGSVDFVGLTVRYADGMPPARGVAGSATFSEDAWKFAVRSGNVAGLDVTKATVDITALTRPVTRIAIDASTRGPLRDALLLVDHPPLRYAKRAGIDPAGASGSIQGRVQLAFPLAGAPIPPDLGAVVRVDLKNAALPKAIEGHSVTQGNLRLDVRASTLELSGTARLENAPLQVRWKEDLAAARGISRTIDVQGRVDPAERTALGFDLRPWLTGPVDVKAHLEQAVDGAGSANVDVDLTPGTIAVPELRLSKAEGAPGQASGKLAIAHGSVVAVDDFRFAAGEAHARGRATVDDGRFRAIDLAGELPPAAPGGERPDFSLTVTPAARDDRLVFTSEDASALLKLILPDATVAGGALRFTGTIGHGKRGLDLAGSFTVDRFNLTESSLLTRVATLASLPGIVSALRSQGIAFDRLSSDLEYASETATFERAVLTGPSLRLVFGGTVDGAKDRISIDGTLVPPLYGLNALPGKIPLIGKLFRSGDGGFVGIDFTVHGEMKDPKISVKPLSSLAPGVLKSLTSEPSRK